MAESNDWRTRLEEARRRVVFEPTPTGATPHVNTLERLAEQLDAVEVAAAASSDGSPASVLAMAVSMLLRESINARMYDRMMAARFEVQPDRVDRLCDLVDVLLTTHAQSGKTRV